jgi:hypothetical protein
MNANSFARDKYRFTVSPEQRAIAKGTSNGDPIRGDAIFATRQKARI